MSETKSKKEELAASAWEQWREEDYSWEGLKKWPWSSGTLQDYWLTDPETGRLRTEADLRANGELIGYRDYPDYHICHLPLNYADGTKTTKATNLHEVQAQMNTLLSTRLKAAAKHLDDDTLALHEIARFDGLVCLKLSLSNEIVNIKLENAIIEGETDFNESNFSKETSFYNSTFLNKVFFNNATLSGKPHFKRAKFSSEAHFQRATFSGETHFDFATFSSDAYFDDAVFIGKVRYDNAAFISEARFDGANFSKAKLSFAGVQFSRHARFQRLSWPDDYIGHQRAFQDAIFTELANFGGSGFRAFAAFDGAKFQNGLRFDKTSKADSNGKSIKFKGRARHNFDNELKACKRLKDKIEREQCLEALESGCRTLKNEMIKQADKSREQLLYKFELVARQTQNSTRLGERSLSFFYGHLSDYGGSARRPFLLLISLFLIFSLIYGMFLFSLPPPDFKSSSPNNNEVALTGMCASAIPIRVQGQDIVPLSLSVSASRFFPMSGFEDASKRVMTTYDCGEMPWPALGFRVLAYFQSLLIIILTFLLGLALRRRFQMS